MDPPRHQPHDAPPTATRRLRRALADPALHAALLVSGFLLASCPFVRSRPAGLAAATLYLFVVWALFVLALAVTSRARRPRREDGACDDE